MIIQELIEELEELEDLDMVLISKNGYCEIYEGKDIEFIDEETLNLLVKHYGIRVENSKRRKYRIVNIEC